MVSYDTSLMRVLSRRWWSDLASLKIKYNISFLFLPFLSSVGIPPQVTPDWRKGGGAITDNWVFKSCDWT